MKLRDDVFGAGCQALIEHLSGPPSIGSCQTFVTHLFLRSKARLLVRIDPDGQFPLEYVEALLEAFELVRSARPDIVIGQRDEASVGGRVRFLGNAFLRLCAFLSGIYADPNSGFYVMNRQTAVLLSSVPLPKYPEPRMLSVLRWASLNIASCVVPTLPRPTGTSSISGLWRSFKVFFGSLLEIPPWNPC